MKKSDLERLKKIVENWARLKEQLNARQVDRKVLLNDEFIQWAVTTPLYNIGERVYQLSDSTRQMDSTLPWKAVAGLRHRLVYDYDGTNWEIIAEAIFTDMDPFVESVKKLIERMQTESDNTESDKTGDSYDPV